MLKKTLFAAAVGGFALPGHAAEPELPAASAPETSSKEGEQATRLAPVTVVGERPDQGFKADDQVSGKMPLTLRETPQSITVLTRESLDDRQVVSLQQALELSAGATQFSGTGPFAGQPSFGFNQTTIRGIPIDSEYDFRDDGFVSGSFFSVPDLAIYDRIEVVKGANSVLYGRGSVGGLINRVRKKPLAKQRMEIELTGGSFDTKRIDFDLTGPLFDSRAVRGRLVAAYEDSGSFVEGVETQRTVLAPSLEFDLGSSTRLLVQAVHQSEDIVPNTGMPLVSAGPGRFVAPKISRRQYNGIPTRDAYQWTNESLTAQLDQQLGDRWLATLRLASSNTDTPIRTDAYVYGFREDGDDPATERVERRGDTTVLGNDFAIDRDILSGELQINGRIDLFGREAKLGFGAEINENQYSRRGLYTDFSAVGNLYDGSFEQPDPTLYPGFQASGKPRSTGVYAQAQIPITDRLKALLGVRYDNVRLDSVAYHAVGSETPAAQKSTVTDVNGRVGLTYEVIPQASVYAVYAQSFTPELFSTDINGDLLDPETGEVFELGTKTEWFGGRLGLTSAVYRIDRKNIPVGAIVAPGELPYSVSSGLQRSTGIEIEINGRPLPGWDVSLAWNTVNSDFKDPRDQFFGQQPGGSANWQLGLYSAYEIQQGLARGFGFGATFYAIDDRGVSTFNTGTIPGYERIDLHAFYKGFRNIELNLAIRNLTNETYIEGADRPGAIAFFGSPTAALFSVKYSM